MLGPESLTADAMKFDPASVINSALHGMAELAASLKDAPLRVHVTVSATALLLVALVLAATVAGSASFISALAILARSW